MSVAATTPRKPADAHALADASATPPRASGVALSAAACLLVSHGLSALGWRAWEFAVALVLADLLPGSLALVAAYGLADDLVQVFAGPWLGAYVDARPRLAAASRMYAVQHALIAASCGAALGAYNTLQSLGFFAGGALGGWLIGHVGASGLFAVCAALMALWLAAAWGMAPVAARLRAPAPTESAATAISA